MRFSPFHVRWALFVVLLCVCTAFGQHRLTGRVVGVSDGDTITVLDADNVQHKIRLAGIDAPESSQDFGQKAKQNLSDLVFGKTVHVLHHKTDRYGRIVGVVIVDGIDVNLEQVRAGFAWHYKQYQDEQSEIDRNVYAMVEDSARAKKLKIWSMPNPVPPWDFRRGGSSAPAAEPVAGASTSTPAAVASAPSGKVIGNRNSMKYHRPDCPSYSQVADRNRVYFETSEAAEKAGYTVAGNCPGAASASPAAAVRAPAPAAPAYSVPGSSSRTYHRGPRGGCYYYSGSGRKVYVARSMCD